MNPRLVFLLTAACVILLSPPVRATDEKFATLKVGDEVYTNVIVLEVTATDIYFQHSRGVGNAKLKKLDPELQKKFAFDPGKASAKEQQQRESAARFSQDAAKARPPAPQTQPVEEVSEPPSGESKNPGSRWVGQRAPEMAVESWLTAAPEMRGKFVMVDFWATWCGPCRRAIPELNAWHKNYGDQMVVVGLSNEPEATVRGLTNPKIEYYSATDTHSRMAGAIGVQSIPYTLVIDPFGFVRYAGHPSLLSNKKLEAIFARYEK